jgi:hypothetical protein
MAFSISWWRRFLHPARRLRRPTKAFRRLALEPLEDRTLLSGIPGWINAGPNPISGSSGRTSAALPDGNGVGAIETVVGTLVRTSRLSGYYVVYAGTANGGVWRADNIVDGMFDGSVDPSTLHWTPLTDQQPSLGVCSLAIDPSDPSGQTLWVGTGQLSSWHDGGPGVGLLKTTDGGATWTNLQGNTTNGIAPTTGAPPKVRITGMKIMSVVPTIQIENGQPTECVLIAAYDSGGVLYSRDGGQTFYRATLVDQNGSPLLDGNGDPAPLDTTDLVADPNDPQRFYAAVAAQFHDGNLVAHGGIFRGDFDSTGQMAWTEIDNGITLMTTATALKLAVANDSGTTMVYVATGDGTLTGVFRSLITPDGQAARWFPIGTVPTDSNGRPLFLADVPRLSLVADPTDPDVVYGCGGDGWVERISAADGTWLNLSGTGPGTAYPNDSPGQLGTRTKGDSRHVAILNDHILLNTDDGGIFGLDNPHSPGSGLWVSLNSSLENTEFLPGGIAYDETTGHIAGGSQDVGTPVQNDSGGWNLLPSAGGDGGWTAVSSDGVYYYNDDDTFYRTADPAGQAHKVQRFGLTVGTPDHPLDQDSLGGDQSFPFVLNPFNSSRLLLGRHSLYESMDGGDTLTNITPAGMAEGITALAYGVDNPDAAYVGAPGQLFVRSGPGATFTKVATWTQGKPNQIVVDPDDYRHAYILSDDGRIWMTNDAGATFDLTNNLAPGGELLSQAGLPGNKAYSIAVFDPTPGGQPGDSILLAGTQTGVYRLLVTAANQTWYKFGSGLPNARVTSLGYYPRSASNPSAGDVLVAGTLGRGAWIIHGASSFLAAPSSLDLDLGVGESVTIVQDPNLPQLLDIIRGNGSPSMTLDSAIPQTITINGSDQNHISLSDVPVGTIVTVNGGTGSAVVNVGAAALNMDQVQGLIYVNNSNGSDVKLNLYDQNGPSGDYYQLTGADAAGYASFYRDPTTHVYFANLTAVNLFGSHNAAPFGSPTEYRVDGTVGGSTTIYSANGGSELHPADVINVETTTGPLEINLPASGDAKVYVSPTAENLFTIAGTLTVNGSGFGTLILDDQDNPFIEATVGVYQYAISSSSVANTYSLFQFGHFIPATRTINYSGLHALELNGGNGALGYEVNNTAAGTTTTINTGGVSDTVNVEATSGDLTVNLANGPSGRKPTVNVCLTAKDLDVLQGNLTIGCPGTHVVNVNDQAHPTVRSFSLQSGRLTWGGPVGITFSNITSLVLNIRSAPHGTTGGAIMLTPAALPADTINVPYDQLITASNGNADVTLAVSNIQNAIPGLVVPSGGKNLLAISGTPTATGTETFTVTATDAGGNSTTASYSIVVNPAVSFTPQALPVGTVNAAYFQALSARGGTGGITTTVGNIQNPVAGLYLFVDSVANVIAIMGIPTAAGTETFTVTATDSLGSTTTVDYSIIIYPALTLGPASLPQGTAKVPYSQTITAGGGSGGQTLTVGNVVGAIPGLTIPLSGNNSLAISGTPTAPGTVSFTVTASDPISGTVSQGYTIIINPVISLTPLTLPQGAVNVAYLATISASGGPGNKSLQVSNISGSISGLTIPASGTNSLTIHGRPRSAGTVTFTLTASDTANDTTLQAYTLIINPALSFNRTMLPPSTAGVLYQQRLIAQGGLGNKALVVSQVRGALPPGLRVLTTGVNSLTIQGTPTAAGTVAFTLTARDSTGATSSQRYIITIYPAVSIQPTALPQSTAGIAYSQVLSTSGGTGSKGLTVGNITGIIPGLTIPTSGSNSLTISGRPTAAGTVSFTVTATDSVNAVIAQSYTIVINPSLVLSPNTLAPGKVGLAYNQTIAANGGTGNKKLHATILSNSTRGLRVQLGTNSLIISGLPTTAGTLRVRVTAIDAANATVVQTYSITIAK